MAKQLWHYTAALRLIDIVVSGKLKRSGFERQQKDKHPSIWFSTLDEWDPSANKLVVNHNGQTFELDSEQHFEYLGFGRIGFEFDTYLLTWEEYKLICGLSRSDVETIIAFSKRRKSPTKNWYTSLHDIDSSLWNSVQYFDGSKWVDYDDFASHKVIQEKHSKFFTS